MTISQNSSTNYFETQGNDVPVTIAVNFLDGTQRTVQGAVNWRETANGKLRGIGLRIDQTIADGYPLTATGGYSKTYLLKVPGSTLSVANGGQIKGEAAGVVESLNGYLDATASFTISKSGPTSTAQSTAVSYTIGLGNSGGGVSGTTVTVQDVLPTGMTYSSVTKGTGVSSVSCAQSSQTLTCTVTLSAGIPKYSANGAAAFTINAVAPSSGSSMTNYASVDPNGTTSPPAAVGCSSAICARSSTTLTGTGVVSGHFTRRDGTGVSGATINLLDSGSNVVGTTTTNASGQFQFTGLLSGTYGVRFVPGNSFKGKAKSNSGNSDGQYIKNLTITPTTTIADADAIAIDPAGVIYDTVTREALAGAVVKLMYSGSVVPNTWLDQDLGGANTQTTSTDGVYNFVLNGSASSGVYTLAVTPPTGYRFQSLALPPSAGPFNPGLGGSLYPVQTQSTAPTGSDPTTYYVSFNFTIGTTAATTSNGVINNHIPLDPVPTVSIANNDVSGEPKTNGSLIVSLSGKSATNTVVSYTTSGSATPGTDYETLSGTVTIPAGDASALISVLPKDDTAIEGDETVVVTLSSVTSGSAALSSTASDLTATNVIADDEVPKVTIAKTTDAAEPSSNGSFTVTLESAALSNTVIAYKVEGTATSGTDYTALSGTVTIPTGDTTATIALPVKDDNIVEGDETVVVTLKRL